MCDAGFFGRARRRSVQTWAAALVLLCLCSGCVRVAPTREPVTITFICDPDEELHYEQLVADFHKDHKYVTVEFVNPSQYRMPEADVLQVWPWLRRFARDEILLLDLSPYIEQGESFARDEFYPHLIEMFSHEDEIWAVPFLVDVTVMYYNRDLFDAYRVDYPQPDWRGMIF